VGAAQQTQVLGDSWTGDGESSGDLPGGLATAAEQVEDGSTGGISEGVERGFLGLGRICNRTVTHNV